MNCHHCNGKCIKKGLTDSGIQKYRCTQCKKYQRSAYIRNGFKGGIMLQIKQMVKESCGIRSLSRILRISTTTVLKMIRQLSACIIKPVIKMGREFEADELKTYVKNKRNEQWVIYVLDKKTRKVVDFCVGKRTKKNIKRIVDTLLYSKAKKIWTDKLTIYKNLIPAEIHNLVIHNTNYIERNNLNLRIHLKYLSRKTICFSKSVLMLESILRIYFFG